MSKYELTRPTEMVELVELRVEKTDHEKIMDLYKRISDKIDHIIEKRRTKKSS
jgi:hypothetical protein